MSDALNKVTCVNVILPKYHQAPEPKKPYKTLYLFHGMTGDHTNWMRSTSIQRYANKFGIAVVMPDGGKSWYTNTAYGDKYLTFVGEELPAVCRSFFNGMSDRREDNYVAGLSMGGYGAMKVAMTYPDKFCGCATLSGALDITRERHAYDLNEWRALFGFDLKSASELAGTEHDIYALVDKVHKSGVTFPKTFIWCGTGDSWLYSNTRLHEQLDNLGIPHSYNASEGVHSWEWWDLHIQNALAYLLEE